MIQLLDPKVARAMGVWHPPEAFDCVRPLVDPALADRLFRPLVEVPPHLAADLDRILHPPKIDVVRLMR